MNRFALVGLCAAAALFAATRRAQAVTPPALNSTFENSSGPTLETSFGAPSQNWINGLNGLLPHSGAQFFESDNGNQATNFEDLRYVKQLGGVIQIAKYDVSFFIASNLLSPDMQALILSDFDKLVIGGAGGSMLWLSTPTPTPGGGWFEWRGLYTPSVSDVGTPFRFEMTVDIDARHSLALDGPIVATVHVPEPGSIALAATASLGLMAGRRRRLPPWVA